MLKFRWETEFKETENGEIPKDWEIRKLGEVVCIKQGKNISTLKLKDWGYPVFGANGLIGYTDTYHYEEPQVLIACRGSTCGIINWSFPKSFVNNNAMTLLPKSIDKKFLYFSMQLNFISGRIDETITGTGQPQITKETLEPFLIFYPPLPEQSRIATVLSWFDDLIENKKRQNEILEKTAMAIFKSWFVDFEPFRACPEQERGNCEFVYNEELGKEIPKGWEVKKLGEVVKTQYGVTISGENFGEIKLLRITDINKTFVIDWDNVPYCNIDEKTFYKYNLSDKDIVISRIADIGKVAIIENPPRSVFASYLIRLKIKSGSNIMPYYLYYWLKSEIYQEYILGAAEGSTRENTNAEVIKDGPILIPDISILQKFEELACDLRSKIILNQKQIMTLRKIRDTLLPLLVFGKLRIEEV
jgi:type I restriction enzyme S subunit